MVGKYTNLSVCCISDYFIYLTTIKRFFRSYNIKMHCHMKLFLFFAFLNCFFNTTYHIESLLWQIIMFAVQDFFKSFNGIFCFYIFSWAAGKDFSYEKWLTQETLNFSCTCNQSFVFIRQFIHTKNCDNILEIFISLEYFLNTSRNVIVILS